MHNASSKVKGGEKVDKDKKTNNCCCCCCECENCNCDCKKNDQAKKSEKNVLHPKV